MTVDVEDYFHVHAFASTVERSSWEGYPSRVEKYASFVGDVRVQPSSSDVFRLRLGSREISGVGSSFLQGWPPCRLSRIRAPGHLRR
jgi:hypothetical protein